MKDLCILEVTDGALRFPVNEVRTKDERNERQEAWALSPPLRFIHLTVHFARE